VRTVEYWTFPCGARYRAVVETDLKAMMQEPTSSFRCPKCDSTIGIRGTLISYTEELPDERWQVAERTDGTPSR